MNKKYYFEEIFIFNPDYVFVNVEFVEKWFLIDFQLFKIFNVFFFIASIFLLKSESNLS